MVECQLPMLKVVGSSPIIRLVDGCFDCYEQMLLKIEMANSQKAIDYLDRHPIIDVVQVSPASAYKLIVDLVQLGILEEITGGKLGRQYMFMAYLNLFK